MKDFKIIVGLENDDFFVILNDKLENPLFYKATNKNFKTILVSFFNLKFNNI